MTSAILLILESALWIFPKLDKKSHQVENTTMAGSYTNKSYGIGVPDIGYGPQSGITCTAQKLVGTNLLYDVIYHIDNNGLRYTPPASSSNANAILFFGGSFTFGEGVNNDQAMPYRVATISDQQYNVFNFGFHGYGPHQMLAALDSGLAEKILDGLTPATIIYQALPGHALRAAGASSWDRDGPAYILTDQGKLIHAGTFRESLPFSPTKAWWRWQTQKSSIGRMALSTKRIRKPRENDAKLMVRIVEKSRQLAKEKWPNAEFHILFWDSDKKLYSWLHQGFEEKHLKMHIINQIAPEFSENPTEYTIPLDGHPNAKAHNIIANYIVTNILNKTTTP